MKIESLQEIVWLAFFTALIAVSAFLSLPIGPIPFSMQPFVLYLCAFILGSKKASLAVLLYLFLGLIGFPFFAGGKSGLAAFLSPTGGFLLAFAPTVFIAGLVRGKSKINSALILMLSLIFLYSFGTLWLMHSIDISFAKAFMLATVPFILPDLIKIVLAYFLYKTLAARGKFGLQCI